MDMPGHRAGHAPADLALHRASLLCATLVPAALITRTRTGRGIGARQSRVAQSAERPAVNRQVIGSSPIAGAGFTWVNVWPCSLGALAWPMVGPSHGATCADAVAAGRRGTRSPNFQSTRYILGHEEH